MAKKASGKTSVKHIEHAIPPAGNTAIYQWHKYWGRKPHNVVREFIEAYCPEDGVVLDPFVGSGVTAIEALKSGRRAVVCDLNPISRDIILATVNPPKIETFRELRETFVSSVKSKALKFYEHSCFKCGEKTSLLSTSVLVKEVGSIVPQEFRYECGCSKELIREKAGRGFAEYYKKYKKILNGSSLWWPDSLLEYKSGQPFKERQRFRTYEDLFTPRNLLVLSTVWNAISEGKWSAEEKELLRILFRSVVHLCANLSGDRRVRPLSAAWTQHSFWFAKNPVEINAWHAIERKLHEYEKVIDDWFAQRKKPVRIARTMNDVMINKADLFVASQDCASFLKSIHGLDRKPDYVFTDPPYNGMIQYGELSFIWNAWRQNNKGSDGSDYIEGIEKSELTENTGQGKRLHDYYKHLRACFTGISSAVNPGAYIHLTYTSPKVKYRNLTLRAARLSGLEFDKLHFQQSVRESKKSLEQPFGSVFGDFIFRFRRPEKGNTTVEKKSKAAFEEAIRERTIYMLKHRGEPTPSNIVIAECERELYRCGFFDDDKAIQIDIKKAIANDPLFVQSKDGQISFKDESRFNGTPLSLRVEKTVREMLAETRVVTFTEVWSNLLKEYPNSLTPDSSCIAKILKKYAEQTPSGTWEAKSGVLGGRASLHNQAIKNCAESLKRAGYSISIGKAERNDPVFKSLFKHLSEIDDLLNELDISLTKQEKKRADNIDVVAWKWLGENLEILCFEVETSTNFIDAFERFEPIFKINVDESKLILLVAERGKELSGKMKNKLTFKLIPKELKEKTFVVTFQNKDVQMLANWRGLEKKITKATVWTDIEGAA